MRTKKTVFNFLTDSIPQILILIIGFFKIKVFLDYMGEDKLGLYQLYNQIVSYLVLVEGGIGSALLFRLYKPISEKNHKDINSLMSTGKYLFNIIGVLIFILGIGISFCVDFFIKDGNFNFGYLQITFILYLISQVVNYFTIPYRVYFDAKQEKYVTNLIFQIITLLKSIFEIIIVILFRGDKFFYILYLLIICGIISNFLLIILFKKRYKDINFKSKKDFSILKDVRHLFVNTLATVVSNNIDIILISKFIGLKAVVVYSSYNYFVEAIKQLIDKISASTMSGIGDLLVADKKKAIKVFKEFNSFVFFVATVICIPFYIFINGFIDIYYNDKIITSYIMAILFTIILFYQIIRIPLKTFTLSGGLFAKIKKYTLLEIIINIIVSIILLNKIGLCGVLIGTIVSLFLSEFITKPVIICRKMLEYNVRKYYLGCLINTTYVLIIILLYHCFVNISYSTILGCFINAGFVFIIVLVLTIIFYKLTNQLEFVKRLSLARRKK